MTSPEPPSPSSTTIQPPSPRFPKPTLTTTTTTGPHRKIAIAVDLSDESAYAVNWAVQNYLRPNDVVILLHVRPTSILYGADWGAVEPPTPTETTTSEPSQQKLQQQKEEDFDELTASKTTELAKPLIDANISYKIHIVKDHDMKERLCLEVERLGLSAVIMGSRGFGSAASRRRRSGKLGQRLGSVSDYCVHHCVCPVVVVRFPDDDDDDEVSVGSPLRVNGCGGGGEGLLKPVPEEEPEFHDAIDTHTDLEKPS